MANAVHSTRAIPVEHVTIRTTKPFDDVREKLATLAPRIDDAAAAYGCGTLVDWREDAFRERS